MRCAFCEIAAGRAPAEIVWADERFLAFLDTSPIAPGHLLLIPRAHAPSVFDLPDAEYAELFQRARALQRVLLATVGSRRIGLAVEGFGVEHAHVHLVPVDRGGDLDPGRQQRASPEELRATGERLREALAVRAV